MNKNLGVALFVLCLLVGTGCRDNVAPTITLVGPSDVHVEFPAEYEEPGYSARDYCKGDLTWSVVLSQGTAVGDGACAPQVQEHYYTVNDWSGNTTTVTRTVTVCDTTAPTITLGFLREDGISIPYGQDMTAYEWPLVAWDAGSEALSKEDINDSLEVIVENDVFIDSSDGGAHYRVGFQFTDCAGNMNGEYHIAVNVKSTNSNPGEGEGEGEVPDTTSPVITLMGSGNYVLDCGNAFNDPGAMATDDVDGDLTASIVRTGSVDTSTTGTYVLVYNVSDSAGNSAVRVTRRVTVRDTTDPVITLLGDAQMTVECDGVFVDPGATALDRCDGSVAIGTTGVVDVSESGVYTLIYSATDSVGNAATNVTRTVTVGECVDENLPVLLRFLESPDFYLPEGVDWESGGNAIQSVLVDPGGSNSVLEAYFFLEAQNGYSYPKPIDGTTTPIIDNVASVWLIQHPADRTPLQVTAVVMPQGGEIQLCGIDGCTGPPYVEGAVAGVFYYLNEDRVVPSTTWFAEVPAFGPTSLDGFTRFGADLATGEVLANYGFVLFGKYQGVWYPKLDESGVLLSLDSSGNGAGYLYHDPVDPSITEVQVILVDRRKFQQPESWTRVGDEPPFVPGTVSGAWTIRK